MESSDSPGSKDDTELQEQMQPPGENAGSDPEKAEDSEDGIPMRSIGDDVEGDEETEDLDDVESGDA